MLAFEPGAALCDGRHAIARYVAFGLWSDALVGDAQAQATAQARALLRAALYWLAGTAPMANDGAEAVSSWASQVAEFRAYAHARTSLAKAMQQERRVRARASGSPGLRGVVDDDDDDVLPPAVRASHVIVAGDFNIAHAEVDIKNWKGNRTNAGFLPEERAYLDKWFGGAGTGDGPWADLGRALGGPGPGPYTWWSWRGKGFDTDGGWRIDYVIATPEIAAAAKSAEVGKAPTYAERWSDHAPLIINFT
jgi:endonuclease/exonuclease/phosphatase family metal-dependent hydrolase